MDLAEEPRSGDSVLPDGRPAASRSRAWRPGVLAAAVALCLGVLGAGLAASGTPAFGSSTSVTVPVDGSADAGFARNMATHHQQAIDLSFIVRDRTNLRSGPHALLVEEPDPAALGWAGGRAHEIVVPVTATRTPAWPRLPKPAPARIVRRGHGDAPGTSRVLLASLYGDPARQDTVLARHLPDLLERLGRPA
ncbi:hypothetical protein AB0F71_35985 [Kitasatospora sp. NPDC028055]|uniref:hypothetical protein n=1 Tax=Kitasatospora sp. NPDC028055 TaxID=3155653 RepID=UPI0033E1DF4A